ncbi:MAG: glycosyltransferase family 2 protein [Bacteroidales bacterium]
MDLDIIIPVYNEAELIQITLEKLRSVKFPEHIEKVKIIVVDDSSTDNSAEQINEYLRSAKAKEQEIVFLQLDRNLGKGAAVRHGMDNSSGDLILIQDADLELTPQDIPSMLEAQQKLGVEFVNGSRYLPGIPRPLSSYRRYIANRFMTWLTSILINVKLTDMACGYKLFTRNLYKQLNLRENGFGIEAEIIIKAMRIRKNNITEVPVNYFPRNKGEGKKISIVDGFRILGTIIKYSIFR